MPERSANRWLSDDEIQRLRAGDYADPPYVNLRELLADEHGNVGYASGTSGPTFMPNAGLVVDTRWIPRRGPFTVLAGMPRALEILNRCTGLFRDDCFRNTAADLKVWAVADGTILDGGQPLTTGPALVVVGRYNEFAHLKTPILGTLARSSRVATNTYRTLLAARGKPVFTFCARYDLHEAQALDGYAYDVAVRAYSDRHGAALQRGVSTAANGHFTGQPTIGTLSHEATACFLGDTPALMRAFCERMPVDRLRVALVDFRNDCIAETREVMRAIYCARRAALDDGADELADRFRLDGVRLDTSRELVDVTEATLSDPAPGVTPRLVQLTRDAIDSAWASWDLPSHRVADAQAWCHRMQIIVSGGFDERRIAEFEEARAPVDAYGVGSALLAACPATDGVTDLSATIVAVWRGDERLPIAKTGRGATWRETLAKMTLTGE